MTLDQLRYFQAVCKYAGVSRAAQRLNISQPSVSNAIANLEKEFGVELFTRQHKQLILTTEGQLLAELADSLLQHADETQRVMQDLGTKNKVIRLGVPPMIGSLILPALHAEYFNSHPNLQVHIVEEGSSGLKRLLSDNQIDMAFLPHTHPFSNDLCSEALTTLQNVCCVNSNHRLSGRSSLQLAELKDEPMVLFKNSFFQTERILREFSRLALTPNVLLSTSQLSTVQNMIACNAAIGFLFDFLPKTTSDIVGIPLDPPMTTQVSLVWNKSSRITGCMQDIIRLTRLFSHTL